MKDPLAILITGTSTGLGKATAEYLASRGHRVYGTSRNGPATLRQTGIMQVIAMDVTDDASVRKAIDAVVNDSRGLDAIVNNAGLHVVGPLENLSISDIEACIQTNYLGPVRVCQALLPHFRERGRGRIVNIGSLAGMIALPFQAAYSASKFALEGMTQALRAEVRPFGISVSLINPGDIRHQDCHAHTEASAAYARSYARAMQIARADEEKGFPAERLGPLVERVLLAKRPLQRYYFGQAIQKPSALLKRLLPERLSEWAIRKYYGI